MRITYEEIFELLGIKNVSSKTQKKNGTHVFELPFETRGGERIRLATYKSGAVRNLNSCYSCYQLNPTRLEKWQNTSFDHKVRIPITSHEGRLEFLLKFIIRNYYKKQHTITKYKVHTIKQLSNITVTVDGHRYNIQ